MMNVLTNFEYSKRYYLTHPWKFVSKCLANAKYAWQRITKGYCDLDWWDMDSWLLKILPSMLKVMAAKTISYPAPLDIKEEDSEKYYQEWISFLKQLAADFEWCQEDNIDKENEYYEAFHNDIHNKEISEKYIQRCTELENMREEKIKTAFAALADNIWELWD